MCHSSSPWCSSLLLSFCTILNSLMWLAWWTSKLLSSWIMFASFSWCTSLSLCWISSTILALFLRQ